MLRAHNPATTLIGFSALLMWSSLAALSVAAKDIPPFQLLSVGMAIGGLAGALSWPFRPGAAKRALLQPWPIWLLGIYGLFGYHFCYFMAFRLAPPIEANLINYLWPLLIIVFTAFLPNERLRHHHIFGLFIGVFAVGYAVLTQAHDINADVLLGYAFACACALIWSSYSVLSRRFEHISTDTITGFCLVTAVLAGACHIMFEQTIWPQTSAGWLALGLIGLFPTGLAFYAWDVGVKHGNILLLGMTSYATRIVSTLLLCLFSFADMNLHAALSVVLVTLGAVIASKDLFDVQTIEGS